MELQVFKERVNKLGIEMTEMGGGQVIVPCPLSDHDDLARGFSANFIAGTSGSGDCAACRRHASFEEILAAFAEKAESPSAKSTMPLKIYLKDVGTILKAQFKEDEWLVEGIIPIPSIVALSGMPGDFKTWITIHLALCVARGLPAFGKFPVKQGAVLVVDEENGEKHLQKRLKLFGATVKDQITYLPFAGFRADDEKRTRELATIIEEEKFRLVIIDSLIRIHGQDENDAKGMSKVMHGLQELMRRDAAIVFTHHHRKPSYGSSNSPLNLRGSTDILAAIDAHFMVERVNDDVLVLRQTKARHSEAAKPFQIKIIKGSDGPTGFEYVGEHDDAKKKAEEAEDAILEFLADGTIRSRQHILEALSQFRQRAIDDGLRHASEAGRIDKVAKAAVPPELQGKGPQRYFRIASDQESEEDQPLS